jgi:toxin ParE1/3/4
MYAVRWTRRALRALDAIGNYIARDRPLAADRAVAKVFDAVSALGAQPWMGRVGRVPGTRELIIPGTPLIVPYRFNEQEGRVEVLTVLHAAQQWPDRL